MIKTPKFKNAKIQAWVNKWVKICQPDAVHIVTGTKKEYNELCKQLVRTGQLVKLNPKTRPGCYLARSHKSDVARIEDRTFICCKTKIDAGPTNNWRDPVKMKKEMLKKYKGCMKGRTMYVIPFAMGPIGNPLTHYGIELTDSAYVVINMNIISHTGNPVMKYLDKSMDFIPCIHSVGMPLKKGEKDSSWPCVKSIKNKYIAHFPDDKEIWSFGSAYGGNALLGKKSFALRIASKLAKNNGWLAEHMLILTLTSPAKKQYHFTAAFPSACGKTNLAMMLPKLHGWKLQTISDDIAWLKLGADGRLYAINPEKGFYGVAPGTSMEANPNALIACKKNTIFTNVVLTPDNDVWWENMGIDAPETGIDWTGKPCYRCIDDKRRMAPKPNMTKAEVNAIGYVAAHKNSRFTVPAVNCPVLDKDGFNGIYKGKHTGVPIDAILFGGRRISTVPLITEASNWEHGVFMGSATGSEITAAVISNKIGHVRRDPMAMFPFLGYNITDYFQHWLDIEKISANPTKLPKIYFVNFFRKNAKGKYLWSGFGENIRILKWICDRIDGKIGAKPTAIGNLPFANDLFIKNADGTNIVSKKNLKELLKVDSAEWKKEIKAISAAYDEYDSQDTKKYVPKILRQILKQLKTDLSK